MAKNINYLELSYPNFTLGQIIDPEEANQNNYEITTKVNEFVDEVEGAIAIAESADIKSSNAELVSNNANTKSDNAVTISNQANVTASEARNIASDAESVAVSVQSEFTTMKPELEQAIFQANDTMDRLDDLIDGTIFNTVGATTYKGTFIANVDNAKTFTLNTNIFNPLTDFLELFYQGVLLEKDDNYTVDGRNVTLLFDLNKDEGIEYKSVKYTMVDPRLTDGTWIKDGTVLKQKFDVTLKDEFDDKLGSTHENDVNTHQDIRQQINDLDAQMIDFEVGTWTPSSADATFDVSYATYTKIGNLIKLQCEVDVLVKGTSFIISGLPFVGVSKQSYGAYINNAESLEIQQTYYARIDSTSNGRLALFYSNLSGTIIPLVPSEGIFRIDVIYNIN